MRISVLRRRKHDGHPGVSGVARLDRRTKNLTKRLRPGEIAVIDHVDLDRVSAEALVSTGVAAVINVADSISGRYPNLGPEILADAGIPLVDGVGPEIFARVGEGDVVRVEEGKVFIGLTEVASGTLQSLASIGSAMEEARAGLSVQLEAFAANTMEYLRRERDLLLDGVGVPDIRTDLDGKHALIVVRGYNYKEDLNALKHYIREYKPVLIGVDGGADALVDAGYKPAIIVGDMDSVSDATLRCGAELVVHAYRDGRAPGAERLEHLGLDAVIFPATGTSEDVAMLLADSKHADLIVAVGSHAALVEFLDKGRAGMASTFLTRLRIGGKLVDAKGVSRLYRSRVSTGQVLLVLLVGITAFLVALAATPAGQIWLNVLQDRWQGVVFFVQRLFT
jgi:uncharacterized membrane-anchored protein